MIRSEGSWRTLLLGVVALPWLLYWVGGGGYLVWPDAIYSDLFTAHLPLARLVHDAASDFGQIPLWNPLYFGGQPLAGDPLAGMSYPPNWLTYLLPTAAGFHLLLAAHLLWGALGAFEFAKSIGTSPRARFVAGIIFAFSPRVLGQWGLGHVSLVLAVCWSPWVLLLFRRLGNSGAVGGLAEWRQAGLAGGSLGLVFTIDPRWSLPMALLALGYWLTQSIAHSHTDGTSWLRMTRRLIMIMISAFLASAVLSLPLLEWLAQSTRSGLAAGETGAGIPVGSLLQIIWPQPRSWPEWNTTIGLMPLTLALLGVFGWDRERRFLGSTLVVLAILSLGDNTPLYPSLARLIPGLGQFRMPGRFWLMVPMVVSILGATGYDRLAANGQGDRPKERNRLNLLIVGIMSLFLLLHVGLAGVTGGRSLTENPWGFVSLLIAFGWLLFYFLGRGRAAIQAWLLPATASLLVVELFLLCSAALEVRLVERPGVGRPSWLDGRWGEQRVFSPDYAIPQDLAAALKVESLNGVSPLELQSAWKALSNALGFSPVGYSVTVPPYPSGDPNLPPTLSYDTGALGMLNMTHIVSKQQIDLDSVDLDDRWGDLWVYENPDARPRAWVEGRPIEADDMVWRPVRELDWSPNRIVVQAEGPGRMVLSEFMAPGWAARVDGIATPILSTHDGLRSVELDGGLHTIEFVYLPLLLYAGVAISVIFWGSMVMAWYRSI